MKGTKLRQFPQGGFASIRDEWSSEGFECESFSDSFGLRNKERLALKYSSLMDIMEERMKREECILSTSPHKKVVNAIRYAKAVNSTLESSLEKTLDMLHREFKQEFLRIVDVERKVCEEFSATKSSGVLGTSMAALGLAIAWVDSELSFSINRMEFVVTNVNSSDILTESDIPGALLPQEAPELCNVV